MVKIGEVIAYAGSTAPAGFIICDGAAVSRSVYGALFSLIGTTYGAGDGSTTFNVPNLKGRVIVGYNSGDADFDTIGEVGGAMAVDISHTHTVNSHTHTFSGTLNATGSTLYLDNGTNAYFAATSGHTHSVSGTSGTASTTTTGSALSATQSIRNPYITMNFIIRANVKQGGSFIYNLLY